jgi:prevent-host-death family protein
VNLAILAKPAKLANMNPDRAVTPDDVRRGFRELLNEVEHDDVHLTVIRYGKRAAVIVPVDWYEAAKRHLGKAAGLRLPQDSGERA